MPIQPENCIKFRSRVWGLQAQLQNYKLYVFPHYPILDLNPYGYIDFEQVDLAKI
jgi:hypothetical protein